MASLGFLYMITVAPVTMGMVIYRNKKKVLLSKYHNWSYRAGLMYFVIAPAAVLILVLVGYARRF